MIATRSPTGGRTGVPISVRLEPETIDAIREAIGHYGSASAWIKTAIARRLTQDKDRGKTAPLTPTFGDSLHDHADALFVPGPKAGGMHRRRPRKPRTSGTTKRSPGKTKAKIRSPRRPPRKGLRARKPAKV